MDGARTTASVQTIGRVTLVPERCAVRGPDQQEVVLRPKTFAVLNELLAHRGQLVTREALLAAVWPNVTVSDESLTQCVRELRAALGSDGGSLLRTLPRRGYMLDLGGNDNPPLDADRDASVTAQVLEPKQSTRPRRPLLVVAAALLIGLVLTVWFATSSQKVQRPLTSPRSQAEQLTERANQWFRREASPAAWRGQRELYARAVAVDADHAAAWVGLAFTNANLVHYRHSDAPADDLRAAEAAAERAYALAPNSAEANAAIGAVDRLRPERLEQSLAAFQHALELTPADFTVRAQLGWMMAQLGRAEDGEILLRAALVLAPSGHPFRPSWYYYLGMIDLLLGRGDQGVGWLRQAQVAGGGAYLDAHRFNLTLAAALAQAGRKEEAAIPLREVLARQPDLTVEALRHHSPWGSRNPVFRAQLERVFEGLSLAGLP